MRGDAAVLPRRRALVRELLAAGRRGRSQAAGDDLTTFLGYALPELTRLQIELEYDLTGDGELVHRADSGERDRCCVYVHAAGTSTYFGVEVAPEARQAIVRLSAQEVLSCPELVSERLGGGSVGRFETYVALEPFPGASCEGVRIRNGRAVLDEAGGRPVSWAWSVRESDHAAECAVETAEPFRRRGLAARVTAAWANQVLAAGKVPFYSHETGNEASRALAARLALPHVFTLLGFT